MARKPMTEEHKAKLVASMQKAREERAASGVATTRLDPVERAKLHPKSRTLAINAKCWDCQGGDADPLPRRRIGQCECVDCPLHPVRPYQKQANKPKVSDMDEAAFEAAAKQKSSEEDVADEDEDAVEGEE